MSERRTSAFHRPRPELAGFGSSSSSSSQGPLSAHRRFEPETPARRPPPIPELQQRKLLLSSSKKPPRMMSPRAPSPWSSASLSRRKRYKDAVDSASPIRVVPSLGGRGLVRQNSTESLLDEENLRGDSDSDDEDEDELPSDAIPRIDIVSELGYGHSSTVKCVECRENHRKYALKESKESINSVGARHTMLEELRRWDSLKHKRIVQFFRAWQENAQLHVLMRLCEGGTLSQFVDSHMTIHGNVDPQLLLVACRDTLSALDYMHTEGYVHLDVKPANICLSRGRALLCDMERMRKVNEVVMKETDHVYSAYEVFSSAEYRAHPSADIFSLGISFLELAGWQSLPRNGDKWTKLRLTEPSLNDFPNMSHHPELGYLILHCMQLDPAQRPTARDLLSHSSMDLPRHIRLIPPAEAQRDSKLHSRPASATLVYSPRDEFRRDFLVTSPLSKSPSVSRNPSRGPSPHPNFYHKRLDFGGASPHSELDEISDRFQQTVVTPRPSGGMTPSVIQQGSRPSSPRPYTGSPLVFYTNTVAVAPPGINKVVPKPAPSVSNV